MSDQTARRPVRLADLTAVQRKYLEHLDRIRRGIRPSHARLPGNASLSMLLELKLIATDDLDRPMHGCIRPLHWCAWRITDKGAALLGGEAP